MSGAWRVVVATDDQGNTVAIGPVHADQSLDKLRLEIDSYGWEVQGTARHLSAANFAEMRRRGDGEANR